MRYLNRNDERVVILEETCTCGHSRDEHPGAGGTCQGTDEESGECCACNAFEAAETEPLPVL
ncbi:MAG: hypothetical protein ACM3JD_18360 [Rudaea sp.]